MSRIFVVDDKAIISDTLSEILRISGYEARAFYDAETALKACLTCNPDAVISDVVMPGMSGVDLAIEIRERNPSCRIILISGNVGMTDMLESARIRGYDFEVLVKPVPPRELLEQLNRPRIAPAATYSRSNREQAQTVQNRWPAVEAKSENTSLSDHYLPSIYSNKFHQYADQISGDRKRPIGGRLQDFWSEQNPRSCS